MPALSRQEVQPLLAALYDASPAVRGAALRSLVHLPLEQEAWWEVAHSTLRLLDMLAMRQGGEDAGLVDEESLTVDAVLSIAAHVPVLEVRHRLRDLLESPDETLRLAVAIELAKAWDSAAIPVLLKFLRDSQPRLGTMSRALRRIRRTQLDRDLDWQRLEAAYLLSRLDLHAFIPLASSIHQQEPVGVVRFWLALTLAGAGQLKPLKRAFQDLAAGKYYLQDAYPDPLQLDEHLGQRRLFQGDLSELKNLLVSLASDEHYESFIRQAANDLLRGWQPPGVSSAQPEPSGGDATRARNLALQWIDRPPYQDRLGGFITEDEIDQLRPLDPALATQLVSALFRYLATTSDYAFENGLVELIYSFDYPFQADIPALFESYQKVYQDRQPLGWQIAWTVSRLSPQEWLSSLSPQLGSTDQAERLAALQLIEDAARYRGQSYPPLFGGGEPPPDTLSQETEWLHLPMPMAEPPTRTWVEPDIEEESGTPRFRGEPRGESLPPHSQRVVNTGFAPQDQPDDLLEPVVPLITNSAYFFWIDIGAPVPQSGELTPVDIPQLPGETSLTVVLFSYQGSFQLVPGADTGQLYLHADGHVSASRQPLGEQPPASQHLDRRLFFPLRTPANPGQYALRCNLYWGQILIQSRLIEAQVVAEPVEATGGELAWGSSLDYTLSNQIEAAHLVRLEPENGEKHKLSLLLNDNGDGTHSFHFYGNDGQEVLKQDDVRFGEGELFGMINQARRVLRKASWGSPDEWHPGIDYCYAGGQLDLGRLKDDLVQMAKWGYEFYFQVGSRLANMTIQALQNFMLTPGAVQIAMKESPNYILPAAMIYDYPLDTFGTQYELCPEFLHRLQAGLSLEDSLCFQGQCPSRGQLFTVCPSGFWGFRHSLGMPLSVHFAPAVPPTIDFDGQLQMVMGEATDLSLLSAHEQALSHLKEGTLQLHLSKDRQDVLSALRQSPHLVYFYCHGGLQDDAPYLQIGSQEHPELLLPSNLATYVLWQQPRPLVFLNGCHTTAVDPLKALQFISPLVAQCQCAGVIGTEITIFERLATDMAEEFFRRLLAGETTGHALRGARLKVLAQGNPLGLVYIPFVLASLQLKNRLSALPQPPPPGLIDNEADFVVINGLRVPKRMTG